MQLAFPLSRLCSHRGLIQKTAWGHKKIPPQDFGPIENRMQFFRVAMPNTARLFPGNGAEEMRKG
jgi:hypothetical protein